MLQVSTVNKDGASIAYSLQIIGACMNPSKRGGQEHENRVMADWRTSDASIAYRVNEFEQRKANG